MDFKNSLSFNFWELFLFFLVFDSQVFIIALFAWWIFTSIYNNQNNEQKGERVKKSHQDGNWKGDDIMFDEIPRKRARWTISIFPQIANTTIRTKRKLYVWYDTIWASITNALLTTSIPFNISINFLFLLFEFSFSYFTLVDFFHRTTLYHKNPDHLHFLLSSFQTYPMFLGILFPKSLFPIPYNFHNLSYQVNFSQSKKKKEY